MEQKTAQLRIKGRNAITSYGSSGTIFWETPSRARFLIDAGIAELVNVDPAGAGGTKPAGPTETKPAAPSEKKRFSDDAQDGLSTDSAPSSEDGQEKPASLSAGALRSPQRTAPSPRGRGRPRRSA